MAWIFSMWVESENKNQAKIIQDYFIGQQIVVNEKEYLISAVTSGMITVDGISQFGITSQADANKMTAIGFEFYKLLKNKSEFRYALTGVEVDGWREMSELEEDPNDILLIPGFVIRKDIYKKWGSPGNFVEFNETHLWTPYLGEKWNGKSKN